MSDKKIHMLRVPFAIRPGNIAIWCANEEASKDGAVVTLPELVTCDECIREMTKTLEALIKWNKSRSPSTD